MNCRKCLHFLVCTYNDKSGKEFDCSQAEKCPSFRNRDNFVELPCNVGSEAYHLTSADTLDELGVAEIFNGKVCSFSKDEKGLWIFCRYDNGLTYWYKETDIGTRLFLDRASAEAKLREMEGANNDTRTSKVSP